MSRPRLSIARAPRKPSLAMVKKALRLFKGRDVPKALYRKNALSWLRAQAALGDRHLLKGRVLKGNVLQGTIATWGQPGEPKVDQVFAPRRLGGV